MPYHEVKCPCGKTKSIYRAPGKPAPKYCSTQCRRRFHAGNGKAKKYIFTPEMDEQIRTLYQERVGIVPPKDQRVNLKKDAYKGPVKALADKFGMPRWVVSRRAVGLGVVPVQKKEPLWSETELWILNKCSHRSPPVVQRYLKRAGYRRSLQGIIIKRKRLHLSRATMNGYTVKQLAGHFNIDDHGIKQWITKGWLTAQRRGTARTPQQGGDEWFIRPEWVKEFVVNNVAVIDFRKVDKYWMVEVLTEVDRSPFTVHGSEVKDIPEIIDPQEEHDVSPEVSDMFDEVQGLSTGSR